MRPSSLIPAENFRFLSDSSSGSVSVDVRFVGCVPIVAVIDLDIVDWRVLVLLGWLELEFVRLGARSSYLLTFHGMPKTKIARVSKKRLASDSWANVNTKEA